MPVPVEVRTSVLRSADEVREAEFGPTAKGEVDADMVAVDETIMERRKGSFDPATFRDRYQDALRELGQQAERHCKGTTGGCRAAEGD